MVKVRVQATWGGQLFATAAGRLLAEDLRTTLLAPPCRIFNHAPRPPRRGLAPAIDLDGEWPRDSLYNAPLPSTFPLLRSGGIDGCIDIHWGCRNAAIFTPQRETIQAWLSDAFTCRPEPHHHTIVLLDSNVRAQSLENEQGKAGF